MDTTFTAYQQAKNRVEMKLAFAVHAVAFTVINIGLFIGAGNFNMTAGHFWGWGIGLVVHAGYVLAAGRNRWMERFVEREAARERR